MFLKPVLPVLDCLRCDPQPWEAVRALFSLHTSLPLWFLHAWACGGLPSALEVGQSLSLELE